MSIETTLPFVGNEIGRIDGLIQENGLQLGMKEFMRRYRVQVKPVFEQGITPEQLAHSPTVIISDHPHRWEAVPLIAALPTRTRSGAKILSTVAFQNWGDGFRNTVIPLHTSHAEVKGIAAQVLRRSNFDRGNMGLKEAHALNTESLEEAVRYVDTGGQIIIFPDGVRVGGKWFNGVGRLIEGITNPETLVVLARVGKPKLSPSVSSEKGAGFPKLSFGEIPVFFFTPFTLESFKEMDPKQITTFLETAYNNKPEGQRIYIRRIINTLIEMMRRKGEYTDPVAYDYIVNRFLGREKLAGDLVDCLQKYLPEAKSGIKVLDEASGTGAVSLRLAEEGYDTYATDISPKMLSELETKAKTRGLHVTARLADLNETLPYPDNSFSAVVTASANRYITALDTFLGEVHRVLSPEGYFIWPIFGGEAVTWKASAGFSQPTQAFTLAREMERHGFKVETDAISSFFRNTLRGIPPFVIPTYLIGQKQ